jgi:site-specific recombinase XerD
MERQISLENLNEFKKWLQSEERSPGTIENYLRDLLTFTVWLDGREVSKALVTEWKEQLQGQYIAVTVNAKLSAVNAFFRFAGWDDCRVKFLKVQRKLFRDQGRDLSRGEYDRLMRTANSQGRERLALVMETICATGIRVSEVQYITVEAARQGRAEIRLKGKIRTILLPNKLCRKLLKYAKTKKITSGELFLTRSGKSLSRKQIWAEMKALCKSAGVVATKVFPHNLRHLFATTFYHSCRDIARLADVLGHSSIETTRIYLISTGAEHQRQLDRLGLVS